MGRYLQSPDEGQRSAVTTAEDTLSDRGTTAGVTNPGTACTAASGMQFHHDSAEHDKFGPSETA